MSANNVNTIIDNICAKLGTTVEMVVPEYAKYMVASKLTTFITGVGLIILIVALAKMLMVSLNKKITEYKDEYESNDWWDAGWSVLYLISGVVLIIIGFVALSILISGLDFIPWLISPQGAFIAEVLH